jgi:hypothetical protein
VGKRAFKESEKGERLAKERKTSKGKQEASNTE